MFESSPTAICISTSSANESRYVKVNRAYLELVGKNWEQLQAELVSVNTGAVDPDRLERLHILDTVGSYQLQEVLIRHVSGRLIPTLISCQRHIIDGQVTDIEIITDISERKEFETKLMRAAATDAMTDLPNRAAFDKELTARTNNWREGTSIGLAFIDLNGFKAVNDRYGHAVGDSLLKILSMRLRARTKLTDFVARLGGDEFGVLFEFPLGAKPEVIARFQSLAHHLCTTVRIRDHHIDIGAAVGVATETQPTTPDRLLDDADKLMYLAKATMDRVSVQVA
jgi:diguanylate cyclase (GGDEF)-like protein